MDLWTDFICFAATSACLELNLGENYVLSYDICF